MKEKQREKELAEEENFGDSACGQFRSWLWNVMEYPWTSKLAQVSLHIISLRYLLSFEKLMIQEEEYFLKYF